MRPTTRRRQKVRYVDDRLRRAGAPTAPVPRRTGAHAGTKSIGEALGDVTRDLSVLFQQEVALAKAEVGQTVNRAGQAAGMFAGAAIAAFLFVLFLSLALWEVIKRLDWAWLGRSHRGRDLVGGRAGALLGSPRADEEGQRPTANGRDRAPSSERTQRTRGEKPMTTSNDPDEIRADIERTRGTLSNDVDDLAESVKPKSVARRQVDKVKDAVGSVKDRVMGSDEDDPSSSTVADKAYAAKDAVADKAYAAKDTVSEKGIRGARGGKGSADDSKAQDAGQSPGRRCDRLRPWNACVLADSFQREGAAGGLPAAGQSRAGEGKGLRGSEGCGRKPEAGRSGSCRVGEDDCSGGCRER